jgi:hypothetical protein
MTPRAKLDAGESLNDTDREVLLELLEDRDRLHKMAVGHVQAVLKGDSEDDEEEDPFSFPSRPDDWESERDDFGFPESL